MTDRERVEEAGFEDVDLFDKFNYDGALIGVTSDNRAVYDFDKMVQWLIDNEKFSYEDAVEWIYYNTIRSLQYFGDTAPIIMYSIDNKIGGTESDEHTAQEMGAENK